MSEFLPKALETFKKRYGAATVREKMADAFGTYAYVLEKRSGMAIFCAKDSKRPDDWVSVHAELVQRALRDRMSILLWLERKCWILDPGHILASRPWANEYNKAVMLNFSLGKADAIDADDAIERRRREEAEQQTEIEVTAKLDQPGSLQMLREKGGAAGQRMADEFDLQLVKEIAK